MFGFSNNAYKSVTEAEKVLGRQRATIMSNSKHHRDPAVMAENPDIASGSPINIQRLRKGLQGLKDTKGTIGSLRGGPTSGLEAEPDTKNEEQYCVVAEVLVIYLSHRCRTNIEFPRCIDCAGSSLICALSELLGLMAVINTSPGSSTARYLRDA
ncbi:hypothetical protein CONLIGDRAFT_686852 [Coniochaeta ligniaria NRRL 30616]|uniref:Uncharacterized protein n=1 Tax=Coniochaeta ligniaria NRRL 30616 TaxID=1408157 RepID=A0A1J7I614_9PEZI|nr:hypothetical protein CONLIGDRAFT_686852 [Coniochaeta ligniaria NRRL 30616]